eukprot:3242869-Pyramimonas_sp.AAC.1
MEATLRLAQAETASDVRNACADLEEGTYDIFWCKFLRNSYTYVYVTKEGTYRGVHRHYVQGA